MASFECYHSYMDGRDYSRELRTACNDYSEFLEEEIKSDSEALENIRKALFEENTYVDEGVMWESLKCLAKHLDIDGYQKANPYNHTSVTPNYLVREKMQNKEKEKRDLLNRLDRSLTAIKVALYGNEEIDAYVLNSAIKNLDFLVTGYNIEEKKLNITRKG